ncbi:hypothetical protein GLAREA_06969 [Glarea lozoyensis ATCC 20868]|uniref:Uncharacterized protein n=1 Tax=Glarea lozoyensis (strain ATCC 20868 / MF5171) TaxID=1116229 RepID=S3DPC8_GLAL2|nr:uncharacterized protein GLAREA_06969 [Glarea lozoyensis ATCC 20868]EPE33956.1 hypothetical protein GLAREA_06969 [Glarea lozoyensis ATCC 20868]
MEAEEYGVLKNALAAKKDPGEVAIAFTKPTREAFVPGQTEQPQLEEHFSRSWKSVIEIAIDTPHEKQEPLVDILRAIQQQNVADSEEASEIEIWGDKVKVWKDMPLFGAQAREIWNRAPGTNSNNDLSASQWQNINAFLARLTALSSSIPAFDFSLYAIWTLRSAFENEESKEVDRRAGEMWFLYAGEVIERLSREGKVFDGKIAREGGEFEGKGWRGFNRERLEVWKEGVR